MNLAEKARAITNDRNQKIQIVIQEIVNYFKEYLNGNKFEQLIEREISDPMRQKNGYGIISLNSGYAHIKGDEEKQIITLEGKNWICPDNFFKTNGFSFSDIEKEVCWHLNGIAKDKLREMGFAAEQYDPMAESWQSTYYWIKFTW